MEIRVETDVPAPVRVEVEAAGLGSPPSATGEAGAAPRRVVKDEAASRWHVLQVGGLASNTRYAYTVTTLGDGESQQSSARSTNGAANGEFTTAPSSDSRAPFTVLVYGDDRTDGAAHAAVVRSMLASPSDFLLNTGDLVQDGASADDWQSFFDIESPLLRNRALFACIGNHELADRSATLYLRYFGPTFDAARSAEPPKLYGSFRWGDARFFLLDAMESFDSGPERDWLEAELGKADAEPGLLWRVVILHHSPWSAGPHGGNPRALRAGIPGLLVKHHIDLLLGGHDHIYERGFAEGVRYVVSGGGGAPLYDIEQNLESTRKAESVHHFVELSVAESAIHLTAKRDDGTVLDDCALAANTAGGGWGCDPVAPVKASPPPVARSTSAPSATKCACDAVGIAGGGGLPLAAAFGAFAAAVARRRRNRG